MEDGEEEDLRLETGDLKGGKGEGRVERALLNRNLPLNLTRGDA
jgi:hypothetical protein